MTPDESAELPLVAYYRGRQPGMKIVPAGRWREWMSETYSRTANRCLPLLVANEFGWWLLNERRFTVEWSGGQERGALKVEYDGMAPAYRAESNFGEGIVTFRIPYLFRTPQGWDLSVRGPANLAKDGAAPLDAIVETDWAMSTFTMNWKLTRPGAVVTFEEDEPFCQLVPQRRDALQRFAPALRSADDDPVVAEEWESFDRGRDELKKQKFLFQFTGAFAEAQDAWQSDYFRGRTAEGTAAPEHVTKRNLKPFAEGG